MRPCTACGPGCGDLDSEASMGGTTVTREQDTLDLIKARNEEKGSFLLSASIEVVENMAGTNDECSDRLCRGHVARSSGASPSEFSCLVYRSY